MYNPPMFEETDQDTLFALIDSARLATIVTHDVHGGFEANHFPILLDRAYGTHGALLGHCAKANSMAQNNIAAIAIFSGPDAYVSPSWYPSKANGGLVVPTWNYSAVHVHGLLETFDDAERLLPVLERLTDRHEASQPHPWAITDAPQDFIQAQLKRILGFRLVIDRIEGKLKLSQNRNEADRNGVIGGLNRHGGAQEASVAAAMLKKSAPTSI